jgi:hypothetical protein
VRPNEQAYLCIGRTGDGYRYDYFHVGGAMAEHIQTCAYLHETRERKLSVRGATSARWAGVGRLSDVAATGVLAGRHGDDGCDDGPVRVRREHLSA